MCQEAGNFSMVMEFLPNGSLDALIADSAQPITETFVWKIARGAAAGMASLASQHVVHRDLAARNILLGSDMSPKVADFGYARVVGEEAVGKTKTTVGPIRWMSPESIANREFSEKVRRI
jgi:serine/threonine protein kinase